MPRRRSRRGGAKFRDVADACRQLRAARNNANLLKKLYRDATRQFHPDKVEDKSAAALAAATKNFQDLQICYNDLANDAPFVPEPAPPPPAPAPRPAPAPAPAPAEEARRAAEAAEAEARQARKAEERQRAAEEAAAQERQRQQERAAWIRGQREADAAAAERQRAAAEARVAPMLNKERERMARVGIAATAARSAQVDQEIRQDAYNFRQGYYQRLLKEFRFLPEELRRQEAARIANGALEIYHGRRDSGRVREADAAVYVFRQAIALYRESDDEFASQAQRDRMSVRVPILEADLADAERAAAYLRNNRLGGGSTRRSSLPIRKAGHSSFSGTTRYTRRRRA